jgi:hypothetical protein
VTEANDPSGRHYTDETAEFSAIRLPKHAAPDTGEIPAPLPASFYPPVPSIPPPPRRHAQARPRWWARAWQWIVGG